MDKQFGGSAREEAAGAWTPTKKLSPEPERCRLREGG